MKALILAAGRGNRFNDITDDTNKCMLKFNKKPILESNLKRAVELDVDEIIIVVGHKAEDIVNAYGTDYLGKKIKYVIQWELNGSVHALKCAKNAIGKDDFFLLLGDEIMKNCKHKEMLDTFKSEDVFALCGVFFQKKKENIKQTYAVLLDEHNRIFRLIEKPNKILNNWQGTGHIVFKNRILSYIDRTPIHQERGEKELPDLIQCAIDDGEKIEIFNICEEYKNINSMHDLKGGLS